MGPACHRGDEGPVGSREQDDERLDKVRVGRGLDTGGKLLGRQRAGGPDAPWLGCCPAGTDNRARCGGSDGGLFPVARGIAIGCCRAQHLRAGIGACLSGPGR